jgi:hypothetical protein
MIDKERTRQDDMDAAGGVEGGMPSGSAGGPGQDELEKKRPRKETSPKSRIGGDFGQGSFEQSQNRGSAETGRR